MCLQLHNVVIQGVKLKLFLQNKLPGKPEAPGGFWILFNVKFLDRRYYVTVPGSVLFLFFYPLNICLWMCELPHVPTMEKGEGGVR